MNTKTIFLFGLAGVGKSFLARHIAHTFGYYLYEGDEDITPAMRTAIACKTEFTDSMRDEFFEIMTKKILDLQKQHAHLVIAQGLYRNRHRKYLIKHIPGLQLVWVVASNPVINERIMKREGIAIAPDYAKSIQKNFEEPEMDVIRLHNEGSLSSIEKELELMCHENN